MSTGGGFIAPRIETARIINVNIRDWSVDVVTEYGDKLYLDIQVGSPYFHYANGEGIYVMPEVGAYCWLCRPSSGLDAHAFILAFQSPFDDAAKSFRSNRPQLNPGDIMMKTRDENFIILRRGGVVQVGATPAAQRIYLPIKNTIRDFCENYGLHSIAGDMEWVVHRTEKDTAGGAKTEFRLGVKEKASDPYPIAELFMGSPDGADAPEKLTMIIYADGSESQQIKIIMNFRKDGGVEFGFEGDFKATIKGKSEVKIDGDSTTEIGGKFGLKVNGSEATIESASMLTAKAGVKAMLEGGTLATVKAGSIASIDAPSVKVGGNAAVHPLVYGDMLTSFLTSLLNMLGQEKTSVPSKPVIAAPAINALMGQLAGLTSKTNTTS